MIKSSICIIKENNKVLMLKRHSYDRTFDGWCFPGGKVDPNETSEEAAIRELLEETGLVGFVVRHMGSKYSRLGQKEFEIDVFEVTISSGSLKDYPTEELEKAVWIDIESAMSLKIGPTTKWALEQICSKS